MAVFPNGKHDQADSTAQFLDWFKIPFPGQNIFELSRRDAEAASSAANRNLPKPSMRSAPWNGLPNRRNRADPAHSGTPILPHATVRRGATTDLNVAEVLTVRIRFAPADSPCLAGYSPPTSKSRAFPGGVQGGAGGSVGRDARGAVIWRRRAAISLSGQNSSTAAGMRAMA
jgi:hypothetical protein